MKKCHIQTVPSTPEQARWRAQNFDLVMGRLNVPVMREANINTILIDYVQPTNNASSWTKYVRELSTLHSISYGCYILVSITGRSDGILLDTPLDFVSDPWHGVDIADSIDSLMDPDRKVIPNFGDAETWMGRTEQWKAMHNSFDWHLIEVWIDINNYDIRHFARRAAAVSDAIANGKTPILGIYDNGRKHPEKSLEWMHNNPWGDNVYWSYKISLSEWGWPE